MVDVCWSCGKIISRIAPPLERCGSSCIDKANPLPQKRGVIVVIAMVARLHCMVQEPVRISIEGNYLFYGIADWREQHQGANNVHGSAVHCLW